MPSRKSDFPKRVGEFIERHGLLAAGDAVVVGVSGGADSMALLHVLHEISTNGTLPLTIHVAHLNHRLRGEAAEQDAAFVEQEARRRGLKCTIHAEDIRAMAADQRKSIEEMARNRRYAFFARVCASVGSPAVAVAHQADDQAETVIHRIARGTGLRGLGGIHESRPLDGPGGVRLIRPLLGFRRDDLRGYLEAEGVAFREDASNLSDEHTRSRVRRHVLPAMAAHVNPQVTDAVLRLAEQARSLDEYLRERAGQILETLIVSRTDREVVLNVNALTRKSRVIQTEIVRQALLALEIGEQDVNFGHLSSVADLAIRPASGKELHLPGGVVVRREYDRLSFLNPSDLPHESAAADVAVVVPGTTTLPVRRIELCAECDTFQLSAFTSWRERRPRNEEWLDYDQVRFPLVVRSRRDGDRFWPLGAPGTKKLSDFFIEQRVPGASRGRVAVLCDLLGPVWIVPYRIDERVKVTRLTRRVLKLTATPLA